MYYTNEKTKKINEYLKTISFDEVIDSEESRQLAKALFDCITDDDKDTRTNQDKLNQLIQIIDPNGEKQIDQLFSDSNFSALKYLMSERCAHLMKQVWERASLYPYSFGYWRKPYRSVNNTWLYLSDNLNLLKEMVYSNAFGEYDLETQLRKKAEHYNYSRLTAAVLAYELDSDNEKILNIAKDIIYGENDNGVVSRELIYGLLMSRNKEAHKLIGDLLLAAKLQEGLRQAIVESMDEGSREGYLYILNLILEQDLVRFSSVARAIDTSTGLGFPPDKPNVLKKCMTIASDCLHDKSKILEYSQSPDNLHIYMSLWAAAFDEITDAEELILTLVESEYKYRRLTALYFLKQTFFPKLQNKMAIKLLPSEDLETLAWCMQNLLTDCSVNEYRITNPGLSAMPLDTTPKELFLLLQTALSRLSKKEIIFQESVFSWYGVKLSASDILEKMLVCVSMYAGDENQSSTYNELMDAFLAYTDKMSVDTRSGLVKYLLSTPKTEKQKTALLEALGDKSPGVRSLAHTALTSLALSADDILKVEAALQYKSADLRKNCITLLLRQEPESLFDCIKRLIESNSENKRLGAIEVVSVMKGDTNFDSVYKKCERLLTESTSLAQLEKIRISEIIDAESPVYTPENGFGLYDPNVSYAPVVPNEFESSDVNNMLNPDLNQLKAFFTDLSDLIHENRAYQYERINHNGSKDTVVLGTEQYIWNILIDANKAFCIDNLPLSQTWKQFVSDRGTTDKELMSYAYTYSVVYAERDDTFTFLRSLPYLELCKRILSALVLEIPAEKRFSNAHTIACSLYHSVPLSEQAKPILVEENRHYQRYHYFCETLKVTHWLFEMKSTVSTDDQFNGYFDICYAFYKASDYKASTFCNLRVLETADYGKAFEFGIISENELLLEICGRQSSPLHISNLTSDTYHEYKKTLPFKALHESAAKAIKRIVSMELLRGEMPTCVSDLAGKIHKCFGIEVFAAILPKMEKDSYVRGYLFVNTDSTKNHMFSHLLKCSYPNKEDDAQKLKSILAGNKISDVQLIEAAMYAPQWMDIAEDYLGWDGLRCAAWYFHAHVNEQFSNDKQSIVARYSSIDAADFKDGAFDVAWFWEAYTTLGEKRFQIVYKAAKYVGSAAQHKRAQLFSDAVTGKLNAEESQKTIAEKRNKDLLLAYALIPLQDRRDALHRYEFIQLYLKQSKQYGAQRQASEGTAARIALENLARNAGFADSNRFMWQMETDKLEELVDLFKPMTIEDIQVQLIFDEKGFGEIACVKDGKKLKDIPSKLKKHPEIERIKVVHKELKQQHQRARVSLENAMVSADEFELQELDNLAKSPVLYPLIRNLVFITGSKHGYYSVGQLVDFAGLASPIDNKRLRIAHPDDLFKLGVWAEYQHDLFSKQVVQPFKQVFREYYKSNADELQTLTYSNRYAGHQVQPKRTLALLKSRGWTANHEEGLQKVLLKENLIVSVWAMADWFSPADIECPTLETIAFHDRKSYTARSIDSISPIVFSEVMRDLDLVVSVAHAGGIDPEASLSTIDMRDSLLSEMLRLMKIKNVELRKPHAFIKGSLGEYTVHLGSGTVQKMAAGNIYIIPVHSQHRGRLFLPFMDEDPKTAEIISKIILLAEDNKIKDPEILNQIN